MMYVIGFVALALVIGCLLTGMPMRPTRLTSRHEVRCGDCGQLLGYGEDNIPRIIATEHRCERD